MVLRLMLSVCVISLVNLTSASMRRISNSCTVNVSNAKPLCPAFSKARTGAISSLSV